MKKVTSVLAFITSLMVVFSFSFAISLENVQAQYYTAGNAATCPGYMQGSCCNWDNGLTTSCAYLGSGNGCGAMSCPEGWFTKDDKPSCSNGKLESKVTSSCQIASGYDCKNNTTCYRCKDPFYYCRHDANPTVVETYAPNDIAACNTMFVEGCYTTYDEALKYSAGGACNTTTTCDVCGPNATNSSLKYYSVNLDSYPIYAGTGQCPNGTLKKEIPTQDIFANTCEPCYYCEPEENLDKCPIYPDQPDFDTGPWSTPPTSLSVGSPCPDASNPNGNPNSGLIVTQVLPYNAFQRQDFCGFCEPGVPTTIPNVCPLPGAEFDTSSQTIDPAEIKLGDPCPDRNNESGTLTVYEVESYESTPGRTDYCGSCADQGEYLYFCDPASGYITATNTTYGDGVTSDYKLEDCSANVVRFRYEEAGIEPLSDAHLECFETYADAETTLGNPCVSTPTSEVCPVDTAEITGTVADISNACKEQLGDTAGYSVEAQVPNADGSTTYCYTCEAKTGCDCSDIDPKYYSSSEEVCEDYVLQGGYTTDPDDTTKPVCEVVPVNIAASSSNCSDQQTTLSCWEAKLGTVTPRSGKTCEPYTQAKTRITGYVISDPDTISGVSGGGRCTVPNGSGALGGTSGLGTITKNNNEVISAKAEFQVALEPHAGAISPIRPISDPSNSVTSVGRFTFLNLPWNTDKYDLTLRIENDQQTASYDGVDANQEAVWVCQCPAGFNGDPFTCKYINVPAPTPSNDCLGGDNLDATDTTTGRYTRGSENQAPYSHSSMIDTNCTNPAANFYVTVWDYSNDPWWQAAAGNVFAAGNLISNIPASTDVADNTGDGNYTMCTPPHCSPYIINNHDTCTSSTTGNKSAGYPFAGNTVSAGNKGGDNTFRPSNQTNTQILGSSENYKEDYKYFAGLMPASQIAPLPTLSGSVSDATLDACNADTDNSKACSHDGDLTIPDNTQIKLDSGKYTIFVNGSLIIGSSNVGDWNSFYQSTYKNDDIVTIKVTSGAYLAFIVKNDIIVQPQVGLYNKRFDDFEGSNMKYDSSQPVCFTDATCSNNSCGNGEDPVIEGVFIADGSITIAGNPVGGLESVGLQECNTTKSRVPDKKFVGAGTFVGWSGINLERSFDDQCSFTKSWHSRSPTESFTYRPDFLINTPDWMRQPLQVRQETL